MMAGIVAAARPAPSTAPAVLWTPLNMAVVPQLYLDAQDSVVTDVSGACSAISNLGAMGSSGDFLQATAARRPAINASGVNGKRVLQFDGVDDVLTGNTTQQLGLMRNASAGWSFEVVKKRTQDVSGAAGRIVFDCRNGTTNVRFGTLAHSPSAGAQNKPTLQIMRLDGGAASALSAAAASGVEYEMRLLHVNYATGVGVIYTGGVISSNNPTLSSTGNTSDTPSFAPISVGAYNTGVAAADIDLASIVVGRTALAATEIDKLFGWAAHKYGLAANLPTDHPYKTLPPTV